MKQLKCLLFVAAVALSMVGCRKPVEVSFESNTQEIEAQGGSVDVALKSNGEWTISASEEWITVSPMSGNGDATLTLTAVANTTQEPRLASITASTKDNSATLTVEQKAPEFYLTVTPKEIQCGSDGGEFTVMVSSNVDWSVTLPHWITSSVTEGSDDATVTLYVSPLEGDVTESRTGAVTFGNPFGTIGALAISDQVHVLQMADPVLGIEILPQNLDFVSEGETKSLTVTTEDAWTASVEESWVTLSQTEGQGDAEINVTVGENPLFETRQAMVVFTTAGNQQAMLVVRQEASIDPHFLEASPLEFQFGKEGGDMDITVGCDTDWEFELSYEWLSLSQLSGNGNAVVVLTAEPNLMTETRSAVFFIKSGALFYEFNVYQEAGDIPIVASFDADSLFVPYTGGLFPVQLSSNTTWQLQTSSWIGVLDGSGEGDATFDIIVDSYQDPNERVGYVNAVHNGLVLGTLVVVQEGKPNLLETDITQLDVRPEGGDYVIQVTSNQHWTLVTDVEWLHCNPTSGFANGSFTITVDELPSPRPRTGRVKVSGSLGAEVIIMVDQH